MSNRRSQWRLHHQIIVVVSVLVLLATAALGGYTGHAQGRAVMRSAQTQVTTLARNLAISSANPLLTNSLDVLEELAVRSADFENVLDIRVLGAQGEVLSHVRRQTNGTVRVVIGAAEQRVALPEGAQQTGAAWQEDEDKEQLTAWHAIEAGGRVGWVRVDYSLRSYKHLQRQVWVSTAIVALTFVTLCVVALYLFLKGPLRAVRQATVFAVGLKDVQGQQLSVSHSAVELEALGGALNEASMRLHQQVLAMQHQNECLGAIFALSPDGLLTLNFWGQVEFANDAFLNLTGLRREVVAGATLDQLNVCLRERALEGTHFAGIQASFEAHGSQNVAPRLVLGQGESQRVLMFTGLRGESSVVSGVIYVCDVTQRERLDQMKSDFLALAAHELRTPMTSIYGFAELLMMRAMPPEMQKDLIARLHRQTEVMVGTLNELLDLARIEAKKGTDLLMRRVDFVEVVSQLCADFDAPVGRESLVLQASSLRAEVRADRNKLRQILFNLLSNAYKYSPGGGPVTVSFVTESAAADARVGVAIRDQGVGMTPEQLKRMGERFFRADKSGHIPGTGLGVSIVMELADLMGAQVAFSSEWQKGTVATLWFTPATQDSST